MPGETLVVVAGALADAGVLDLPETMVVVILGAIVGDSVGYELGRVLGRPWLERHGRLIGAHRGALARVDALFERHGGKAVLVGRFVGFLRALAPFAAGASRMPYGTFLVYNVLGAAVWGAAFVLLGYFLGASWTVAERWIGRAGVIVGVVVIAAAVLWLRKSRGR